MFIFDAMCGQKYKRQGFASYMSKRLIDEPKLNIPSRADNQLLKQKLSFWTHMHIGFGLPKNQKFKRLINALKVDELRRSIYKVEYFNSKYEIQNVKWYKQDFAENDIQIIMKLNS